jgi:putative aminopeptidase FrvX
LIVSSIIVRGGIMIKDFLFDICSKPLVSGFEYMNADLLKKYFGQYTDSFEKDNIGSYIF